jgi:uncharacterized metal-binding protein YceD (DUF177 family)
MLRYRISGIKDGKYEIDLESDVSAIREMPEEYFGKVKLKGILTKIGKRLTIVGRVTCSAKFVCDISLEDFTEEISTEVEISYLANNEIYFLNKAKGNFEVETGDIVIHEDEQEVDFTEQIRQELMLSLPMKRIAPAYRDKSIEEIYPEFMDNNPERGEIDERWQGLKNLNLEN